MGINPSVILSLAEIKTVVADLKRIETIYNLQRLAIFRLSACCGLRCKEMHGLDTFDLKHNGQWPYLVIRKDITKGERGKRKARQVPLWWDWQTYLDLKEWCDFRMGTERVNAPFLAGLQGQWRGHRLSKKAIAQSWSRIIRHALGEDRARVLSIHKGRHSFASIALSKGVTMPEVRDALGHSSLAITDIYTHAVDSGVRSVFGG